MEPGNIGLGPDGRMLLYKYFPLRLDYIPPDGPTDLEKLRSVVVDKKLWFTKPADFNDPFDCSPILRVVGGRQAVKRRLGELGRRHLGGSRAERRIAARDRYRELGPDKVKGFLDAVGGRLATYGVTCFSADQEDVLMWSHYASAHGGVCLRFSVGDGFLERDIPLPVHYADERPVVDMGRFMESQSALDLVLTKALRWRYEQEFRAVKVKGPGAYPFDPSALIGVAIGCKATDRELAAVQGLVAAQSFPIPIHRATANKDHYSLDFERVA